MTAPDPAYVALLGQINTAEDAGDPVDALIEQLHTRYLELVRGGTTPNGYPYPDPTDPLAEGADAIRALAEALANRTVTNITSSKPNAAALPTAYPEGVSFMLLSNTEAAAGGWPNGTFTGVYTFRGIGTSGAMQIAFNGTPTTKIYSRNGNSSGWGVWRSASAPFADAMGTVNFPTTAPGATATATVTLPASTFTQTAIVVISPISGSPSQRAVSVNTVSSASFIAVFTNTGSGSAGVTAGWRAGQASDVASAGLLARGLVADTVDATVTCPTAGCSNEGVPIDVPTSWTDDDGVEHPVDEVLCGVCGVALTPLSISNGGTTS